MWEAASRERADAADAVAIAETAVTRAKANVEATEQRRAEAQQALRDLQNELEAARLQSEKTTERVHRQEMKPEPRQGGADGP